MQYRGIVIRTESKPPLKREEWLAVCRTHPKLQQHPPQFISNPFDGGRKIEARPAETSVRVVTDGQQLGTMSWAEDDSPLVNVFSSDSGIDQIAHEIAAKLAANYKLEVA